MHEMILAVDFDGTLCKGAWPGIGDQITEAFDTLFRLRKDFGAKLILWTCRTGVNLSEAVNWCAERGLEFDAVNENLVDTRWGTDLAFGHPKVFATFYIDDRSIGWRELGKTDAERWQRIYEIVRDFERDYP